MEEPMEEIACIFCKKKSDQIVIKENGYLGRKCSKCEIIYISPRPSFNEIIDLYGHDQAHITAESHIAEEFLKRLYSKHNLKIVNMYSKNGSILEIGAGAGYFLDEARKLGFKPYGVECNPIQAKFIRDELRIPCEESPLSASLFEGKKFDVVYHCEVISHFFDPISEFWKINQKMKEGGILVFETGNLGEMDKTYYKYFTKFQYPDHLFFFSSNNLLHLLAKTGFEFIRLYRYSILPELIARKALSGIKNSINSLMPKFNKLDKTSSDRSNIKNLNRANYRLPGNKSIAIQILKNGYLYLHYIIRYKIGRIAPKINRPQTVIVVARKKDR